MLFNASKTKSGSRAASTIKPVFGNLRGKTKVDGQWKLYCMMHNIEKLANHGYSR